MRRALLLALAIAGTGLLLYRATLSRAGVECEACMAFGGRQACSSVAADTRREAERLAISTACATLSGGVADSLRCDATPPLSLRCDGE